MEYIRIGALCVNNAEQQHIAENDMIDYVDISSIDNERKCITSFESIRFADAPSRARKLVRNNDIIVSTVRPNLNAVALCKIDTPHQLVVSTGFCVLSCKPGINYEYLFHFCQSNRFIDSLIKQATGASYPAVNDKIIRDVTLPNYSLSEQNKISMQLSALQQIIHDRKQQLKAFNTLIKARFVDMFGDPFAGSSFEIKKLMDVSISIADGSNIEKAYYANKGDVLFLRIQNIWFNEFKLDDSVFISDEINHHYYETSLHHGDLLITKIGRYYTPDSSLGRVAVYLGEDNKANYSNNIMRIRLINGIHSEFVNALMNLENYNKYIRMVSVGGTDKRALSKAIVGNLPIIVPPYDLQILFVNFVHQIEKSKAIIQRSIEKTQLLYDSLMQEYFG